MERFKVNTTVLLCDGYMDCQGHIQGQLATVIGYAGARILVRDQAGNSEYVSPAQLQRLPAALRSRLE